MISRGYLWLIFLRGRNPSPEPPWGFSFLKWRHVQCRISEMSYIMQCILPRNLKLHVNFWELAILNIRVQGPAAGRWRCLAVGPGWGLAPGPGLPPGGGQLTWGGGGHVGESPCAGADTWWAGETRETLLSVLMYLDEREESDWGLLGRAVRSKLTLWVCFSIKGIGLTTRILVAHYEIIVWCLYEMTWTCTWFWFKVNLEIWVCSCSSE